MFETGNTIFDRYEVLSHLGEGGMGHVYKVLDKETQQILALKTLIPKAGTSTNAIIRFRKEFAAMQSLNHPNIIKAYNFHELNEISQSEQIFAFTMELVEGRDLDSLIYQDSSQNIALDISPLSILNKLSILEKIADGLTYAHKHNLIHRDLKPANIMISRIKIDDSEDDFIVKIADFGLAQQESEGADMSQSSNRIGTAYYMSPEQHRGEELDARTDIYSFGILAYELITGQRPFDGSTTFKLFLAHVSEGIPEAIKVNPETPKWISTMIEICGEKEKKHRYGSMNEILELIRNKKDKQADNKKGLIQKIASSLFRNKSNFS